MNQELEDIIREWAEENSLPYVDVIGTLEIIKQGYILELQAISLEHEEVEH